MKAQGNALGTSAAWFVGRRGSAPATGYSNIDLTQGVALGWLIPGLRPEEPTPESFPNLRGDVLSASKSRQSSKCILHRVRYFAGLPSLVSRAAIRSS